MPLPPPYRVQGPRVIVIGAGVVGLGCGMAIARRGLDVTMLDADAGPAERRRAASAAAAGMLGAFSEVMHEGPGHHRRMNELGAQALRAWRALATGDAELSRLVRFSGALLLSHDEGDSARVRRAYDRARFVGARAEVFEGLPHDLDGFIYGAKIRTAARLADEGFVPPAETLARLAEIAVTAGASLLRGRAATEIIVDGGRTVGVRLDDGSHLPCDVVVIATGALGDSSLHAVAPAMAKLTPAKGLLGWVPAPPGLQIPDLIRTPRVYILRSDGRILFGSTSEWGRTDLDEDPDALASLYLEMRRALPGVKFPARAEHAGVGLRPVSPDGAPLVGPNGPIGCFLAVGHGRNGWLLGPITGEAIAAYILGEELPPIWTAFKPERFG